MPRHIPGRGSTPGGGSFLPSKSNLYNAVKSIFHPSTNSGVSPDDVNKELDVTAVAQEFGALRLALRWSHPITINTARRLTRQQTGNASLAVPGAGEIWAVHIKDGDERTPLGFFLASDLEAFTASDGTSPTTSNSLRFVLRAQTGTTAGSTEAVEFYLSKDSLRRPLLASSHTRLDGNPLTISRLEAQASTGGGGGSVAWSAVTGKPAFAAIATSGRYADLIGAPTFPSKASDADVDAETDDTDYMTVLKVFRAIARKVRNASTTVRGIVEIARNEDVDSTETDTGRVPDVGKAKRLLQRLVPAVFRSGNNAQIPAAKLGTGTPDATKALFGDGAWKKIVQGINFDILSIRYQSAQQSVVSGIDIGDTIAVGGSSAVTLYAWVDKVNLVLNLFFVSGQIEVPSGNPSVSVGGTVIANLVDSDRQTTRSNVDADGEWWWVTNLPAPEAILSELDDAILSIVPSEWGDFAGQVPDGKIPAAITRDTEIAGLLSGMSLAGTTLEAQRQSGSNPVELMLPIGRGLARYGFWVPAADANNGNMLATGIILPVDPDDDKLYFLGARWGATAPTSSFLTGKQIKTIPIIGVGASPNDSNSLVVCAEALGNTLLHAGRLATGELLLGNDEGAWDSDTDFFALYEFTDSPSDSRHPAAFRPEKISDQNYNWDGGVGSAHRISILSGESGTDPLVIPSEGFILISVHGHIFAGNTTWRLASDLIAADADHPLHLLPTGVILQTPWDLYTNAANHVFLEAGSAYTGSETAPEIQLTIWHVTAEAPEAYGHGLSYYRHWSDTPLDGSLPISITQKSAVTNIAADSEYSEEILSDTLTAGLNLGAPIFIAYSGHLFYTVSRSGGSGRTRMIFSLGYRLFPGTSNQITFWREWPIEFGGGDDVTVPLSIFETHSLFPPGMYPTDAGPLFEVTQALFDRPVPFQLVIRFQGWNPAASPLTRRATIINKLTSGDLAFSVYQLGPAPQAAPQGVKPTVARFDVTGNLEPVAGDIGGSYQYDAAIGQSSHASSARIVYFPGVVRNPSAVTVLKVLSNVNGEVGSFDIPSGTMLTAGSQGTIRLEVYETGQTPSTNSPIAYQDVRIMAHAPVGASVRFIRVPRQIGSPAARPTAATLVSALGATGAGVIATGITPIGDWTVAGIPETGQWLIGWIVAQSVAQPNHYSQAGIRIDQVVASRFAFTQNGVDYYVYLFADTNYVDDSYDDSTISVT